VFAGVSSLVAVPAFPPQAARSIDAEQITAASANEITFFIEIPFSF